MTSLRGGLWRLYGIAPGAAKGTSAKPLASAWGERRESRRDVPGEEPMAQTAQLRRIIETAENEAQRVFTLQRQAYLRHPYPSLEERQETLRKLDQVLVRNTDAIADPITPDFGHRALEESLRLELFTCVAGIRHTRRKLAKWMRPQRRHVSMLFATGSNRLVPQPKGVVGIVSPWNYPLFLTVSPL